MSDTTLAFFYGTVLRGQPSHHLLDGAVFVSEEMTAPKYRLFSVEDLYPALAEASADGAAIAGELYELSADHWDAIRKLDPAWMHRAGVDLQDGRAVDSMLADVARAGNLTLIDISQHGGWRSYSGARR